MLRHRSPKDLVLVVESDSQQPPVPLQQKLQCLKAHLKRWKKEFFGHVNQKKEDLLRPIKELDEKESARIISENNR